MEEVKIFSRGVTTVEHQTRLEKVINAWLAENGNKIEIVSRQASCCSGVNEQEETFVNCTVVIFYRQKLA